MTSTLGAKENYSSSLSSTPTITWEEAVLWLRNQPQQQELVKACFYDDPLLEAAIRYHQSSEWQAVQLLLPSPSGKALDIGAGRGIASFALAKDGWDVTALEPDPSAVVGAKAIHSLMNDAHMPITIVEEWGECLPFPDATFDMIHARQVLHHARNLQQLCAEMARVLKPDGVFIATREHVISKPEDLAIFLDTHPLHKLYGGENAFMLAEYLSALKAGGLKITKILSPLESDINCFPNTIEAITQNFINKHAFPFPKWLVHSLLAWKSKRCNSPGCLYTFVGKK